MNLKTSLLAAIAIAALSFTTPVLADSLGDVYAKASTYDTCGGSTCTSVDLGTRTEVIPGSAIVAPATKGTEASMVSPDAGCGFTFGFVNSLGWCIPGSSVGSGNGGGNIIGYNPDGSKSVNTQTTSTLTISYDPALGFADGWSTTETSITVDVP